MGRSVTLPPAGAAGWWQSDDEGHVLCNLCPRQCHIAPGKRGFCFVRENRAGQLVSSTYGRSTGFCVDPIEKKPLYQFYPGTAVLSFGTAGCNLGCRFCQNWTMSRSRDVAAGSERARPETVANAARKLGCRSVAFTYNDPIIWAEYAIDTAKACAAVGVKTVAVTSGYIGGQARGEFFRYIDAANVDLKGFSEAFYRDYCAGQLAPVLDTLRYLMHETEVWLEITNLIIPGANDTPDEIESMCRWIVEELGPDVPLHFTAFHPDFKVNDRGPTPLATLLMAHRLARQAGMHYVYTGNVDDPEHQSTMCPQCGQKVIGRNGYTLSPFLVRDGQCSHCGGRIAGRYDNEPGDWAGRRMPVRIADYTVPPAAEESRRVTPAAQNKPALTAEQEQQILRAAAEQVRATVLGASGEPLVQTLGGIVDLPLYGAFVSLKRGGKLRSCCGCLGDAIPLGEAVQHAADRAACDDPRFPPIAPGELGRLDLEVWLLWHPEPVRERGADRVRAVEIGVHGVQIARGAARGLLLPGVAVEHHLDAEAFLQQVCRKAGLSADAWKRDDTNLMTFEGYAIRGTLSANLPSIRPPAVAGAFYPSDPEAIGAMLDDLMPREVKPEVWAAAMVPHAGWTYSGRLAAATLARVRIPEHVVILSPRHRPAGAEWAVAPYDAWAIPGTTVASDPRLAARLAREIDGLELDAAAHDKEHAIEVQLPLLARLRPDVRVVGITIGGGDLARLVQFGQQLAGTLRKLTQRPLLVVSSDMNHFADDRQTRVIDRIALDAMKSLDPSRLYHAVRENHISMCGLMPAVIVLESLGALDALQRVEEVGYATSADSGGDTTQVVGYAGVLLG